MEKPGPVSWPLLPIVNLTVWFTLKFGKPAGIGTVETTVPTVFEEVALLTLKENVCLALNPPKILPAPAAWTCERGRKSAQQAIVLIISLISEELVWAYW